MCIPPEETSFRHVARCIRPEETSFRHVARCTPPEETPFRLFATCISPEETPFRHIATCISPEETPFRHIATSILLEETSLRGFANGNQAREGWLRVGIIRVLPGGAGLRAERTSRLWRDWPCTKLAAGRKRSRAAHEWLCARRLLRRITRRRFLPRNWWL